MLLRQLDACLSPLQGRLPLTAELLEPRGEEERQGQTMGVQQRLAEGKCLLEAGQGLVRIAQYPQGKGGMGEAGHAEVLAEAVG
jgi:hypothetical protein